MNIILLITTTISLFCLPAFGSCLVSIENGGKNHMVTIWKHTEGTDDTVNHKYLSDKEMQPISGLLNAKNKTRIIFNDGVFTSMDYWDGSAKKWAQLSRAEKDAIFYLQEKFDVTEK